MKWKKPSITKIYEAIGAMADGRVKVSGNGAKVYSSTRNKFYAVTYDPATYQIMSNDNTSYWKNELGYPAIAYLMSIKELPYEESVGNILRGIAWKDINQQFKNDFEKALQFVLSSKTDGERMRLEDLANSIHSKLSKMELKFLGKKTLPPSGY